MSTVISQKFLWSRIMQPRAGLSMTRISLSFLLVLVGGCSKQIRIKQVGGDERPILTSLDRPIDLTIGLIPKEIIRSGKSKRPYASNARELADALAARLRDLHAFRAVYYPLNSDVRPMVEVELESNFFSDAHLGEAKFTGFLVGLSMYASTPFARIRVDLDSNCPPEEHRSQRYSIIRD